MSDANPEIGKSVDAGGIQTNVHDAGEGKPVLLIHGSGPGVSAYANWRLVIPVLAEQRRVIAPDMVGFGYTERPEGIEYSLDVWVKHAFDVLDALGVEEADVVGNSYGGSLALAMATRKPERIRRIVLMGATGVPFKLTPGLDTAWGHEPGIENMRKLLDLFAYNRNLVTDELAKVRHEAASRPGVQEAFSAMFPAPRQRWIDALCTPEDQIRALDKETLIIHGRDDQIIPLETGLTLLDWIPKSQLHVFGQCGHWTQIEHSARFSKLVNDFLSEE